MLSVAILGMIMKIPKMAKIVNRQMPAAREIPEEIHASWAKAGMQMPQGRGQFLMQIPGGVQGMVMAETDTCISPGYEIVHTVNPGYEMVHTVNPSKESEKLKTWKVSSSN